MLGEIGQLSPKGLISEKGKGLSGSGLLLAFQAPEASRLGTHSPEGETEAGGQSQSKRSHQRKG